MLSCLFVLISAFVVGIFSKKYETMKNLLEKLARKTCN